MKALVSIVLSAICLSLVSMPAPSEERPSGTFSIDILHDTFGYTDETPRTVPFSELRQGCPERDCIPAIDQPKFLAVDEAVYLSDEEFVLAVVHNGETKVYPTRILLAHEIVNDVVGGEPMAITFCPLCGSGIAVLRRIGNNTVRFGVSGVLYNSDLVMYDDATESLWSQIDGRAIAGPATGREFETIPLTMARWGQWRRSHPESLVLSRDTGFDRTYDRNRYEEYETSDSVMLPAAATDKRLHPKKIVFGLEVDGIPVAYTEEYLQANTEFTDNVNGRPVHISLGDDGTVTATDLEGAGTYTPIRMYWFAWYVFHPSTELRSVADPGN